MFFDAKKGAGGVKKPAAGGGGSGGAGGGGDREALLRAAEAARAAREAASKAVGPAKTVQRFLRGAAWRLAWHRELCADVTKRGGDLRTLSALLDKRGVTFTVPLPQLKGLAVAIVHILRLQAGWRHAAAGSGLAAVAGLVPFFTRSVSAGDAAVNMVAAAAGVDDVVTGTGPVPSPPVAKSRVDVPTWVSSWWSVVSRLLTRCAALLSRPSGTVDDAASHGWVGPTTRAALVDLCVAACGVGDRHGPAAHRVLTRWGGTGFLCDVIRPALMVVAPDAGCTRLPVSEGEAAIGDRLFLLACMVATAPPMVAGKGGSSTATATRGLPPMHQWWRHVMTVPFLPLRLSKAGWTAGLTYTPPLPSAGGRTPCLTAAAAYIASLWGRVEEASALASLGAASALAGCTTLPPPPATTITKAGAGGKGSRAVAPWIPYSSACVRMCTAWGSHPFLLANILHAAQTDVAGACAVASLPPASLAAMLHLLAACVEALPDQVWTSTTPVKWVDAAVEGGGSPGAVAGGVGGLSPTLGTMGRTPVPMPPLLVTQLRALSGERMTRELAMACVDMRADKLRHPRLRRVDGDDPELGTYDATVTDVAATGGGVGATGGAGSDASRSGLAPASGLGTSLWRGLWETSKLAVSALKRAALGGGGGGGGGGARASGGAGVSSTSPLLAPSTAPPLPAAATTTGTGAPTTHRVASTTPFDADCLLAFARLYALLAAPRPRLPGGGGSGGGISDSDTIVGRLYLLSTLAFMPACNVAYRLWYYLVDSVDLPALVREQGFKSTVQCSGPLAVLSLFTALLSHWTLVLDDYELYQKHVPLPLREVRHVIRLLRDLVAHAEGVGVDQYSCPGAAAKLAAPATPFWPRLSMSCVSTLRALYDRHCSRPLGPADMFLLDLDKVAILTPIPTPTTTPAGSAPAPAAPPRQEAIARLMPMVPFTLPFATRSTMYVRVRDVDRQAAQEGQPQVRITLRRTHLYATAYDALKEVRGEAMKRKIYVTFISSEGTVEGAYDAGGPWKEAWTSLAAIVFDPTYGLFNATEAGELYPNPDSALCVEGSDQEAYEFIGRVLGKALYEGITINPRFAGFFLHKLLGRPVNLHHLPSLDPELYKSLMFLKEYDGDAEDLSLSFTVSGALGAVGEEVELVPGGKGIPVTNRNKVQYIHTVADWRLNKSIERQSNAFIQGLRSVLPPAWLAPFSAPELQVLISGSQRGIDMEDLRAATVYMAPLWSMDGVVRMFWDVVSEFDGRDRAALLKFVTSCERAPPNGFGELQPPFTLHKMPIASGSRADDMLPTASTCFNILHLPAYSSKATMRAKLLLAIHSGAGFELA